MNAIPEPVQPASLELVLADYIKAEGVEVAETYKPILAYVSNLASNQCIAETFHMFEWEKTCQAYLEPIMDAEKAAVVTKKFKWAKQDGTSMEDSKNLYLPKVVLESNGFFKLMKAIDDKIAAEAGNVKPLTTGCQRRTTNPVSTTSSPALAKSTRSSCKITEIERGMDPIDSLLACS